MSRRPSSWCVGAQKKKDPCGSFSIFCRDGYSRLSSLLSSFAVVRRGGFCTVLVIVAVMFFVPLVVIVVVLIVAIALVIALIVFVAVPPVVILPLRLRLVRALARDRWYRPRGAAGDRGARDGHAGLCEGITMLGATGFGDGRARENCSREIRIRHRRRLRDPPGHIARLRSSGHDHR